jgi:hypothetical protein
LTHRVRIPSSSTGSLTESEPHRQRSSSDRRASLQREEQGYWRASQPRGASHRRKRKPSLTLDSSSTPSRSKNRVSRRPHQADQHHESRVVRLWTGCSHAHLLTASE